MLLVSILDSCRQFVVSPRAFFAERPPAETITVSVGLVVLLSVCLTGAILLVGSLLAGAVDATITMDNPERPPSVFCDQPLEDRDSPIYDGCEAPETVERDVGTLIQQEASSQAWIGVLGPAILWVVGAVVLYGAGRVAGGTPSFVGALSVAGWATIPEFVRIAVGLVGLQVALGGLTVTNPEQLETVVRSALAPVEPILLVVSLCTAAWQWHILSGGLAEEADLSLVAAAFAVGVPFWPFVLLTILP